MDIRQRKELKEFAGQRLAVCPEEKKLVLIYSGATLGLALLVTLVNYVLGLQIDQTGGLSNMGTRAVLDTIRQVLPMVQSVVSMCLTLGYLAAMLRIARGQYVSHRTLKLGFDRFWPLLRLTIIRGLIFLAAGFAAIYLGIMLYLATPLSAPAMELLEPVIAGVTTMDPTAIQLDDALYSQLTSAMTPCFVLCGLLYCLLALPIWYKYRLAEYLLIDKPAWGAMMALRESTLLMRRNRFAFFRLDLSLWYYYAGLILTGCMAYGDLLLGLVGITLPISGEVSFFGFYGLYLVCQLGLYYFLRNRVEVTYCTAYESLLPKEQPDNAVVLGNIFQM